MTFCVSTRTSRSVASARTGDAAGAAGLAAAAAAGVVSAPVEGPVLVVVVAVAAGFAFGSGGGGAKSAWYPYSTRNDSRIAIRTRFSIYRLGTGSCPPAQKG